MPRLRLRRHVCLWLQVSAVAAFIYFLWRYIHVPSYDDSSRSNIDVLSVDVNEKHYTECDPNISPDFFMNQERLVHLDLKGAPPKLSYFKEIFPLFKQMGATGLLIEYEDMFPYSGNLAVLASENAYTAKEIQELLHLARKNQLNTIIPLVQTFGHMEFVLKHKDFQDLREVKHDMRSVMPSNVRVLTLVKEMIRQVAQLHPKCTYFHIGSDEVFALGSSKISRERMKNEKIGLMDLYLLHVMKVATYVTELGYTAIVWDDMFRKSATVEQLKASGIGNLVQPMVWTYIQQPESVVPRTVWHKYEQVFPKVWLASAFKGATGQAQYITDINHHLTNHKNWVKIMKKYGKPIGDSVSLQGTILTGWQRYDHVKELFSVTTGDLHPNTEFFLDITSGDARWTSYSPAFSWISLVSTSVNPHRTLRQIPVHPKDKIITDVFNKYAITDDVMQENHVRDWDGTKIVDREVNETTRWIKESIWIRREQQTMNRDGGLMNSVTSGIP